LRFVAPVAGLALAGLLAGFCPAGLPLAWGQASSSSSASSNPQAGPTFAKEKAPTLVDTTGDAVQLLDSEQLFMMASALNACGYDEGLAESDPIRHEMRDEVAKALAASEDAREARDNICLYIAQHKMTGTVKDISQYVSLALYLTPWPALETSVELPQMPPDSTQVVEILPLLKEFAKTVDLNGIWLTRRHTYDEEVNHLHDALTQMIVSTNYYLKMPASTYDGRRFIVLVEPQMNPHTINARVYGGDYVVVVSPEVVKPADGSANGSGHESIRMSDVRHTYLHYLIEPLLYSRSTAMDRFLPILKEVKNAPLDYRYRSDIVELTIECLIKAVEARTMDTGIPAYVAPKDERREDFTAVEIARNAVNQRMEQVRVARVRHEMAQGYVLTAYFYEQMTHFERDPASLRDSIGELVYGMDVDHETHRAREVTFDAQADDDVLRRTAPRRLTGLDLAEAKLEAGDLPTAAAMAREALTVAPGGQAVDTGRANFILARVDVMSRNPEQAIDEFEKAAATAKETRILAWSHIYLGRMHDIICERDQAIEQYKEALAVRDGEQDTRIAAERGLKKAYAPVHSCPQDAPGDGADAAPASPAGNTPAAKPANGDSPFAPAKPGTTVLPTPAPVPAPTAAPQG